MHPAGAIQAPLRTEARDFINLIELADGRGGQFLPGHVREQLAGFARLCREPALDPARQQAEIDRQILELKEALPGYVDVSLMISPHQDSKAFLYRNRRQQFSARLTALLDTEAVDETTKQQARNILALHDFSVGTPPVTQSLVDYLNQLYLGADAAALRQFRDILGIPGDANRAHWDFLMDVLDQLVVQSAHYTTAAEKRAFLEWMSRSSTFRGLSGAFRTVVGGGADTALRLLTEEVFRPHHVQTVIFESADALFEAIRQDFTSVFLVKTAAFRKNFLGAQSRWFPYLTRLVFVDDSTLSRCTNTSLVFCFHLGIIGTLDQVHNKKLGVLANPQLNLRLLLERIPAATLQSFHAAAEQRLTEYRDELAAMKQDQLATGDDPVRELALFKFDEFARQVIRDQYALAKLRDFLSLLLQLAVPERLPALNRELIHEFEERSRAYFYSGNRKLQIATVVEGGGRNQIRTYGDYLLQRRLKPIEPAILRRCRTILDIIPTNYERTLRNHFHKNFGLNLFLEKYKEHLIKTGNEPDSAGRFRNFLLDLGIQDAYDRCPASGQAVVKAFLSDLANLDKTSIADEVQMIIRDTLFHREGGLRPYILYNQDLSWEYQDLLPPERFDLNPFDLEIGTGDEGRLDFDRLVIRLSRMKNTFQLFDDTGSLWDRFCENLTIIINDPANPSGYTDFNNDSLLRFLKLASQSKITLFLDEAYSDSVKLAGEQEPKWRSISRYVMNNLGSYGNLSMVASLSTTKNLAGTGSRLGAVVATPARRDFITFARQQNGGRPCNTLSVFMLVNVLEAAQLAKKLKDRMEERLPKNASAYSFRKRIEDNIRQESGHCREQTTADKPMEGEVQRFSPFTGSPLHLFLLEELTALDKLEVIELPDDFMYKGQPFFKYYQQQLLRNLNRFRVNKIFLDESNRRLHLAKETAREVIARSGAGTPVRVVESDGSYLLNLSLTGFPSYHALESFTQKLAEQRGVAIIPYKTGFVRFSLGGYLNGSEAGYRGFRKELENALEIFIRHWMAFLNRCQADAPAGRHPESILEEIFAAPGDRAFVQQVLEDFFLIRDLTKKTPPDLRINPDHTLDPAFPAACGVTIRALPGSSHAVLELGEEAGACLDLPAFLRSRAFTRIYEYLLPVVRPRLPLLRNLDLPEVLARFGKPVLMKYVENKLAHQPNRFVLDGPDELNIIREILLEMEQLLFSDANFKLLALEATGHPGRDRQRLEGINHILKKHLAELFMHFNLPFGQPGREPAISSLVQRTALRFAELTGKVLPDSGMSTFILNYARELAVAAPLAGLELTGLCRGAIQEVLHRQISGADLPEPEKIVRLYLLRRQDAFLDALSGLLARHQAVLNTAGDPESRRLLEENVLHNLPAELDDLTRSIFACRNQQVPAPQLRREVRGSARLLVEIANRTWSTEYYDRYIHPLMKLVEAEFCAQSSSYNEMIQHGYTVRRGFAPSGRPAAGPEDNAALLRSLMSRCGVITSEQAVQVRTRMVTGAKKREFPFHKIDRTREEDELRKFRLAATQPQPSPGDHLKNLASRPPATFFITRLHQFLERLDPEDYRCKIIHQGLVPELLVIHKSYLKYLADLHRLLSPAELSEEELQKFVPGTLLLLGAPEKLISFPEIGYFDLPGPSGAIKTMVTPLKREADYFGNIKKPRLTLLNEKIKEMGGIPVHGSFFVVEEEDGALFGIQVAGDSGVGKSEMLTALMLKWLKKDLPRIRSIRHVAGDMFEVFPDREGNLYGLGTEEGDFSRMTDFDPEFVRYYHSLFASSADSNVEDRNYRSTIRGLCHLGMPYRIDIMLTAGNFTRQEAGLIRHDNPENFLFYRDSHGERREKSTSSDYPHLQRTLLRYSADPEIVAVLDQHGNYLDEILDWQADPATGQILLCSSYKRLARIDIEEVVNRIFQGRTFSRDSRPGRIAAVKFDIIRNRFNVLAVFEDGPELNFPLDLKFFGSIFNALASTPAGQPFVSAEGQMAGRRHLLEILRGNYGRGRGSKIQLGTLATDLGKTGREVSGPRQAAEELTRLIQEVRTENPELEKNKQRVRNQVQEVYRHIFRDHRTSPEINRCNFLLWQLEQLRKAEIVRIDDMDTPVDLSGLPGYSSLPGDHQFSPLLVTPALQAELACWSETAGQLAELPGAEELATDFLAGDPALYVPRGYHPDVVQQDLALQLLLLQGHLRLEDLNRGQVTLKISREALAAAYLAATRWLATRQPAGESHAGRSPGSTPVGGIQSTESPAAEPSAPQEIKPARPGRRRNQAGIPPSLDTAPGSGR